MDKSKLIYAFQVVYADEIERMEKILPYTKHSKKRQRLKKRIRNYRAFLLSSL